MKYAFRIAYIPSLPCSLEKTNVISKNDIENVAKTPQEIKLAKVPILVIADWSPSATENVEQNVVKAIKRIKKPFFMLLKGSSAFLIMLVKSSPKVPMGIQTTAVARVIFNNPL